MDQKAIHMKILLLGTNGQLGQELHHALAFIGELKACGRDEVDFTNTHSIRKIIQTFQPDCIVNAAAYTAVDKAESERELAFQINAEAVAVLAQEAFQHHIWLIHYSTDYVFDGSKTEPYAETDPPNPINIYGESKLAGEQSIIASGCNHLVFRTTWIMGENGHNFAKTILRLAREKSSLNVINDQLGVPTTPALITQVTVTAIKAISAGKPWPVGLYHLTPQGQTTWYKMAKTLLQLAKEQGILLLTDENALYPIKTSGYPTPAQRPANSLLDNSKLELLLNFSLPHWETGFLKVANKIIEELKSP